MNARAATRGEEEGCNAAGASRPVLAAYRVPVRTITGENVE